MSSTAVVIGIVRKNYFDSVYIPWRQVKYDKSLKLYLVKDSRFLQVDKKRLS